MIPLMWSGVVIGRPCRTGSPLSRVLRQGRLGIVLAGQLDGGSPAYGSPRNLLVFGVEQVEARGAYRPSRVVEQHCFAGPGAGALG